MMVTIAQKSYFCVNIDILSKKLGISNVFNFPPLDSPQFSLCSFAMVWGSSSVVERPLRMRKAWGSIPDLSKFLMKSF